MEALKIRIGFGGILYHNYKKESPKPYSNCYRKDRCGVYQAVVFEGSKSSDSRHNSPLSSKR